jgi:uncharacterized protein (DUF983 family)
LAVLTATRCFWDDFGHNAGLQEFLQNPGRARFDARSNACRNRAAAQEREPHQMKRTLDILVVLIVIVGVAVIVELAANRPIYEQIPLIASWLVLIAVGAVCEIIDIIMDRNAERKASRASQTQPIGSYGVNPDQSSPDIAA